ncbi:MAG TPA: sirohydrochlorin cobaltochelatase [Methanothrix soehngenii]|nr:sirohydrochlorin cobaltochelatase [Methanothrix soehngenii]
MRSSNFCRKTGMLLVPYGSASSRAMATYEKILALYRKDFPGMPVLLAFTSHLMIKRLQEREGIAIPNIEEGLGKLSCQGCKQVVVQSLQIVPGGEFHRLVSLSRECEKKDADPEKRMKIAIGLPLLSGIEDCRRVSKNLPDLWNDIESKKEAVLFAGHGTGHPADAIYTQMAQVLKKDYGQVLLGTIEGFPGLLEMIDELKLIGAQKVRLRPFLLVAGGHAENDISGPAPDSWKSSLERAGIEVDFHLSALGEIEGIVQILKEHSLKALEEMEMQADRRG